MKSSESSESEAEASADNQIPATTPEDYTSE